MNVEPLLGTMFDLQVSKRVPVPCCFCARGQVTFGALWGWPLSWHSEPHCAEYRALPNTSEGVLELAVQCGLLSKEAGR